MAAAVVAAGAVFACWGIHAYPVLVPVIAVMAYGVTLTLLKARVRADAITELAASEDRFSAAFHASPLATCIVRMEDRVFVGVNDAYIALFGYSRDELIGHAANEYPFFVTEHERDDLRAAMSHERGVRDREVRMRKKDGNTIETKWWVQAIHIGGAHYLYVAIDDVTDGKRAEDALRDSEARFRDLAENVREVFWLYDACADQVIYVSPAYESVWKRSRATIARDPNDWLAAVHCEDRERVRTASRGEGYDQHYRIVQPDGTQRWIHDRAFPVRDASGKIIRIAGIAEDVTERRALEDQLRQTQKMESLGMLAGGVAHDFNNLLAVIAASNGMLGESLAAGTEERELVDEIDAAVQRATSLTRQLLAFSRKQVAEPKVLDVNAAVQDTKKMLRRMVGEDVLLLTSLEPDVRAVRVDPGYLVQVLMNLAVNARDAMPRGGTVEISTRNTILDESFVRGRPGAPLGPAVVLSMTDTGCGIAPDVLEHIFEPFFTTKEVGKGTGMGLAVVHGIIEQAGGLIDVDSVVGQGTTFRVYLPAVDGTATSARDVSGAAARGFETILFVDDDEYVRRSSARALRARGYTVIEAPDGGAALGHMRTGIDLLLTDVVMPRMDGRELAEAARAKVPSLKVLYTSGYTDDAVMRHGILHGEVDMLEKPFRLDALAARVRQVLDR